MNNISIIGNLTRDYEVKYTTNGDAIGVFNIAHNDGYGDNEHVSYFEVTTFGKQAARHGEYISKGSKVAITGSIRQDRWEAQDGTKRSKVKIIAHRVQYLDAKKKGNTDDVTQEVAEDDIPF